ncbi:MAG: hypothetical protein K2G31_04895 [Clostridia bacterium]|nr:hypothetical protein [Clostridia bacterium]
MGAVEIVTIIAAVLIVLAVAVTAIVRKVKGKPSISSECCGCPYAKGCKSGHSCHCSTPNDGAETISGKQPYDE